MGNVGRVICVALPFILTVASVIALLVAALAGVTDKSLYVLKLNTTDLSISASAISSLLSSRDLEGLQARDFGSSVSDAASSVADAAGTATSNLGSDLGSLVSSASAAVASATDAASAITAISSENITASDLGLAGAYYISLWNYCQVGTNGTKVCSKPAYNWASNTTTSAEDKIETVAASLGSNVTLPSDVKEALTAFSTVSRWTEIVFIIAFIALGLETLVGLFSSCSRLISCCTWIIAAFATVAVGAAAGLSTAMASVVVGAVEGTAKAYGVTAAFNTRYLATVWLAFAFSLGASLFWVFTICCCAPERRAKMVGGRGGGYTKHLDDDASMTGAPGAYAPLGAPAQSHHNTNNAYGGAGYGHQETGYTHQDTSYQGHGAAAGYYNNDKGFEPMRHQQV